MARVFRRKSMPIEGEEKGSDNASIDSRKTFSLSYSVPFPLPFPRKNGKSLSLSLSLSLFLSLFLFLYRGRRAKKFVVKYLSRHLSWRERIFHRCDDEKITWEIPSIFIIVLSGIARSGGGRRGDMAVVEGGGEDLELGRRREQSRR